MSQDSLLRRYFYKSIGNVSSSLILGLHQILIPIMLGPAIFGIYIFLKSFFDQFILMLDGGAVHALYTKLSKNHADWGLIRFYYLIYICIFIVGIMLVGGSYVFGVTTFIWPEAHFSWIFYSFLLSLSIWWMQFLLKKMDALGYTKQGEKYKIFWRCLNLLCVGSLFISNHKNFNLFLGISVLVNVLCSLGLFILFLQKFNYSKNKNNIDRNYSSEYWNYCHPLFVYMIVSFVGLYIDRWLLQRFYGSTEQGLFGFAHQIGLTSVVLFGSITQLFLREMSIAFHKHNSSDIVYLYEKITRIFFILGSYVGVFIYINADDMVLALGGEAYRNSAGIVKWMGLYSIYHIYHQLTTSMYYAAGETKLYRNISVIGIACGCVFSVVMLYPFAGGPLLGAQGLAIKMILQQVALIYVQTLFLEKILKVKLESRIFEHLLVVVVMSVVCWISTSLIDFQFKYLFMDVVLRGFIYTLLLAILGVFYCVLNKRFKGNIFIWKQI